MTWDLENNASLGIIGFRPDQDVDNVGKLGVADVVVDLDVLACPSGSHSYKRGLCTDPSRAEIYPAKKQTKHSR